jgi:bifunctional pyridoxal-dependent enzyme with beta-cystathionase and maltose regulon repressor activities
VKRSLEEARICGLTVRAMVVINPGNPTGQVWEHIFILYFAQYHACKLDNIICVYDKCLPENKKSKPNVQMICGKGSYILELLSCKLPSFLFNICKLCSRYSLSLTRRR